MCSTRKIRPLQSRLLSLPLAQAPMRTGFRSPAEGFGNQRLELSNLLLKHLRSTLMLWVRGKPAISRASAAL